MVLPCWRDTTARTTRLLTYAFRYQPPLNDCPEIFSGRLACRPAKILLHQRRRFIKPRLGYVPPYTTPLNMSSAPIPVTDPENPKIQRWDDIGLVLIHDFITE